MTWFYRDFGARVRAAREGQPLTQAELAERVGLSRASIANVERGKQHVPLHMIQLFADALGVPADQLLPVKAPSELEKDLPDVRRLPERSVEAIRLVLRKAGTEASALDGSR